MCVRVAENVAQTLADLSLNFDIKI